MSVPNQTPYNIYTANGLTTVFAYEFMIMTAGDIEVSINGTPQTSGYTVQDAGQTEGGQIEFLTPPASGSVVMLLRNLTIKRDTEYQDNGDLLAETINADFDRLWLAMQQAFLSDSLSLKRPLLGGPYNAGNLKIINLKDPEQDSDAATKGWVDEQYSVPTEEAKQAAAEAKDARDESREIADKFGDVDGAITAAEAARDESREIADKFGDVDGAIAAAEAARDESAAFASQSSSSATSAASSAAAAEAIADNSATYADTAAGIAATTEGQYFRVPQGAGADLSFIYYRNDNGSATAVASTLGAGVLSEIEQLANSGVLNELSVVSAGMLLRVISDVYSLAAGSYYTADGVLHTDGGSTWGMYKFPIKKGQWVKYTGPMGILTGSESIPVISQLDSNHAWVSSLRTVNATGAAGVTFQTLYGQATQDGFIAVRGRTAETSTVGAINVYASYDEIVTTEDMLDAIEAGVEKSPQYGPGEDMTGLRYFTGSVFDDAGNWVTGKGSAYRTYFIPVQEGDVAKCEGAMGSFVLAETLPIMVQTDANRNFVSIVYPFETDTKILDRAAWGVATQTGFIAVYVRVVSGITFSITKF
ncbi:TPA: hypothetical protein MAM15_005464, partial [Klebsiella pneumoniae]|nr:hypothetical protein [Klebsiella pneumoniae]